MKTVINCMVKNEEIMLENTLPLWSKYPVDFFIFYDDNSNDNTINTIKKHLPSEKFLILNDKLETFNEGYQRQRMIEQSRKMNFDIVISLDADELFTYTIIDNFSHFIEKYNSKDLWLFWYNIINDSLDYYRSDPSYVNNYRSFILPLKKSGNLDISNWKYHTPRTPIVNLPKEFTKEYGVIHLQSCNRKFYAIKQLWYKHYEYKYYGHSVEFINNRYDNVVNNLQFNPIKTPEHLINTININLDFFDSLLESKGYLNFITKNYKKELITFGQEYI